MTTPKDRPIFIVGAPRSGTTLLRFMLSSHPRIYIPHESYFIPRFFLRNPCRPMQRAQAIRVLEFILNARPFIDDWKIERPDPASFIDALPDLTPASFLDALYSQYAGIYGAERWGDKTPTYTNYISLISEIFPKAQFIHIIRDGRDAALSALNAYKKDRFYVDLYFAGHTWKQRVRKTRLSGSRLSSDRYFELHYEQLVAEPERLLQEICAFLNESYAPAMAEPQQLARKLIPKRGVHSGVRKPLNNDSIGRWHHEMSVIDQRFFQMVAGDLLDELGYVRVDLGRATVAEWARYAGLMTKYNFLEGGRYFLQLLGVFNPH